MAEQELNTEQQGGAPPPPPPAEEPSEGKLSGRSQLRKQLEKNFETERRDRGDGRTAEGRFVRGTRREEAEPEAEGGRQEAPEGQITEATAPETPETTPEAAPAAEPAVAAPEAWSREAKAEWAKLPAAVQAAVSKREADTTKGVKELKGKYGQIDQALEPYLETIKRHGRSPGEAIAQLFAWFASLSTQPQQAFPALAKSFGYDLKQFVEPAQGEAKPPEEEETTAPAVPKELQAYFDAQNRQIEALKAEQAQRIAQFEAQLQTANVQKAKETLNVWAKDKPHFEQAKAVMAELIGRGMVPLLEDGQVDLDAAYDRALYYDPVLREQILQEKQQKAEVERKKKEDAERKAQQDKAEKARKAALSLGPNAPGTNTGSTNRANRGKSVRESLRQAFEEARER